MNKIDEQPDRGSHTVGGGVDASAQGTPSLPGSQPITVETAACRAVDRCSEPDDLLQTVSSKTTSRRAWLRRGVAVASPVVATLVSAPVYAAGACLMATAVGTLPTFQSRNPGGLGVCTKQGPNYWFANFPSSWPNSPSPNTRSARFIDVFGPAAGPEALVGSLTLNEVLGGPFSDLAKYSIAAYLNARTGTAAGFPLTDALQAVAVYQSYRPVGAVVKAPLVATWTESDTVTWLKILMS